MNTNLFELVPWIVPPFIVSGEFKRMLYSCSVVAFVLFVFHLFQLDSRRRRIKAVGARMRRITRMRTNLFDLVINA